MKIIKIHDAIQILNQNDVVIIPTETVYGLAGRIDSEIALKKIFSEKKRPFFDPLIVHVSTIEQAKSLVTHWPNAAQILAQSFWPGPLTLVLPKNKRINPLITSGLDTVAIRIPNHAIALELIQKLNAPLAAPSANLFTKTSPTKVEHITLNLPVIDGGDCAVGVESTVVRIQDQQIEILRPGIITIDDISEKLKIHNVQLSIIKTSSQASPGNHEQHYQPKKPLTLLEQNSKLPERNFCELVLPLDPTLAARSLYAELHRLDQNNSPEIYFRKKISHLEDSRWEVIYDRLMRAATYRI